jgi:galactose oxidase
VRKSGIWASVNTHRVGCVLTVCLSLLLQSHAGQAQNAAQIGAWGCGTESARCSKSGVIPLQVNPIAAALLPSGKVLMWSSNDQLTFESDIGSNPSQTYTELFDPSTLSEVVTIETSGLSDMFCPGTARLPDGKVFVNGGSSSPKTTIYDPVANTWMAGTPMNVPRGYNGDVLLQTGDVFTLGGSWSGAACVDKIGEVWSQSLRRWSTTGISAQPITGPDPADQPCVARGDNHPWLFAASNARIFHAGPSAEMHWITTSGSGSITDAVPRGNDPYSINGNAVMYDIDKILKVGGANAYVGGTPTNFTYVIDISRSGSPPQVQQPTAQMEYARAFANAVVLPNGQVFIVGGVSQDARPFYDDYSVMVPELWNPVSQTFTQLAQMQTPRNYHSTAVLLPDGRVLVGGGGQCGTCTSSNGASSNHLDAEIYSPPYLFQANGSPASRPVISSAPSTAQRGSSIAVKTNGPVSSFALLRLSVATHSVNNDQRRIPLQPPPSPGKSNNYKLAIPSDPGVVLPGYYMLFAINSQGTPSVAWMIQIG